jgi:hypothetical protein
VGLPTSRGLLIGAAIILVLVAAAVRLGNVGAPIFYYRVINDHTVAVGTVTGPWTWTRVAGVTETSSSISVAVSSLSVPLAGSGDNAVELTITLQDPIDSRTVRDANAGSSVQLAHCPPAYLSGSCDGGVPSPSP